MNYATCLLTDAHDRSSFDCGKPGLDTYLKKQAGQDMRSKAAACFVLSEDGRIIQGFHTLSNASISRDLIPEMLAKKLPRYSDLPVTLLGRLAVDLSCRGHGYGRLLLMDALKRSLDASIFIGSVAVVVDPMDAEASDFYAKYGFILLPDRGRMFLPMKTVSLAFQ
jgi:predicted GNAT family N-acyltransferase